MALFVRVFALFQRAKPIVPKHNTNPYPQEENIEMANIDWFASCGSYPLLGDKWEYVSREEIADASTQCVKFMYEQLDAKNAAARNVQPQNPTPFDIGETEVDGYLKLDTPHQMALNFGEMLDEFNDHEEPSFTF